MAKKDPFADLRAKKENVAVGDDVLVLRTATLDQEAGLFSALSDLDLGTLLGPVSDLLSGDGSAEEGIPVTALGTRLATLGPQIWKAAQTVLGRQLAPALRDACTAVLHTTANAQMLHQSNKIASEGAYDTEGAFECHELRIYLRQNLTLRQATVILRKAWEINGYLDALGNLMPLLEMEEIPAAETQAAS